MTGVWFSPETAHYFMVASVLSLTALAVPAIAKGQHKLLVLSIWVGIIVIGMVLMGAGGLAVIAHQPAYVRAPLLLTGLVMALGYGLSLLFVLRAYRMAERRKVAAREL